MFNKKIFIGILTPLLVSTSATNFTSCGCNNKNVSIKEYISSLNPGVEQQLSRNKNAENYATSFYVNELFKNGDYFKDDLYLSIQNITIKDTKQFDPKAYNWKKLSAFVSNLNVNTEKKTVDFDLKINADYTINEIQEEISYSYFIRDINATYKFRNATINFLDHTYLEEKPTFAPFELDLSSTNTDWSMNVTEDVTNTYKSSINYSSKTRKFSLKTNGEFNHTNYTEIYEEVTALKWLNILTFDEANLPKIKLFSKFFTRKTITE